MPIREYVCRDCRIKVDMIETGDPQMHPCPDCQEGMDLVEFSVPARTRVGKYGKAGGLPPEGDK